MIGDVLGCLSRHETQEGQLNVDILWQRTLAAVIKLGRKEEKELLAGFQTGKIEFGKSGYKTAGRKSGTENEV